MTNDLKSQIRDLMTDMEALDTIDVKTRLVAKILEDLVIRIYEEILDRVDGTDLGNQVSTMNPTEAIEFIVKWVKT